MDYLDFELEIGPGVGRDYAISVIDSPAGEAREEMRFPFDDLELENRLQSIQIALLRSGDLRRKILTTEEQSVQLFGQRLFDALLTGEVRSRFDVSQREASQQGRGLRLKLRIQSPELAALPWEYLFDPRQAEYVCLSRNNPIVRYIETPQPVKPLTVDLPLRLLAMIAAPQDLAPLDVQREKQRLEESLKTIQDDGSVELTWLNGQTWRDLQNAMQRGPWHIFHFIGHGGFDVNTDEGLVAFASDQGLARRMSATQLARLLADHHPLRLVLLNSCEGAKSSERDVFSGTAASLVRRGIPAVIAMQYEITDRAAIEFARAFYTAVAAGLPVDAAVAEARKAISFAINNTFEWGIPVLFLRAPDGLIFDIGRVRSLSATTPEAAPVSDLELEQRLRDLYTQGLSDYYSDAFEEAARSFKAIVDLHPDYEEAAGLLEESSRLGYLNAHYTRAQTAIAAGDWQAAYEALRLVLKEKKDFKEAAYMLEMVEKQKQLADLYSNAEQLFQAEKWQAVMNVFERIDALDLHFPDPKQLRATAESRLETIDLEGQLKDRYSQAVRAMQAERWEAAHQLLLQVQEMKTGYERTEQLLARVEEQLGGRRPTREESAQERQTPATPIGKPQVVPEGVRSPSILRRWWRVGVSLLALSLLFLGSGIFAIMSSALLLLVGIEHALHRRWLRAALFIIIALGWFFFE